MSEPLRGPHFSSYAPDEVGWLLKDLSGVELEAPTEEREEAIQSGGAHYAESLPVEYQPTAEYQELFRSALAGSAERIARAVGAVTELVLAERGPGAVLVSLARAGTPVGVLMRRWARHAHGLDLPHYAVSIVRGRGIDANALRWLAAHHDPADAVFVDGWTGKGAITRELAAAVEGFGGFNPDIAVLADPGGCVSTYGTRDDFLIPSACLNSTVSGLISRTVLREELIGPDDFHGAKFYRELLGADVSGLFLDTVGAAFDTVAGQVADDVKSLTLAGPFADLGGLGGRRADQPRSTASATSTWSSPASARPPGCCCAASRGRSSPSAARAPTSTTYGCSPRSAACRWRRSTGCRTPASA